MGATLNEMQEAVFKVNKANGWFDDERAFDDDIALLHSEVSEMFEAYRDWGYEDATLKQCPRHEGHPIEAHLCKPEGFASECADVLVRLLDTNQRFGMAWAPVAGLDDVVRHREFVLGSPGSHIRRLHKLITEIDNYSPGANTIRLMVVLSYLIAWADDQEIDLEAEFERKLAYNETRGHKHGGKLL